MRKVERFGAVQPGEGSRETLQKPSCMQRGPTGRLKRDFLQGNAEIGQGVMALN